MDIEKRLSDIDASEGDPEGAHCLEDGLMIDLLRHAIGERAGRIAALSQRQKDIRRFLQWYDDETQDRTRWYA